MAQNPYNVEFGDLPWDLKNLILESASERCELSMTVEMEDPQEPKSSPLGFRNVKRFVECDLTITLEQQVKHYRGERILVLKLRRQVNADWVNNEERGYSDADRSRLSRLFAYEHTWENITKIAFFPGTMVEFQCGRNKEQAPPWFRFQFNSINFHKLARKLTTWCGMKMTLADIDEIVFEFSSPAPRNSVGNSRLRRYLKAYLSDPD
jgi:hypothetical protein